MWVGYGWRERGEETGWDEVRSELTCQDLVSFLPYLFRARNTFILRDLNVQDTFMFDVMHLTVDGRTNCTRKLHDTHGLYVCSIRLLYYDYSALIHLRFCEGNEEYEAWSTWILTYTRQYLHVEDSSPHSVPKTHPAGFCKMPCTRHIAMYDESSADACIILEEARTIDM